MRENRYSEHKYTYKLCLFADKSVGKKSLGESGFVNDYDIHTGTLGLKFYNKEIEIHGKKIRITLWIFSPDKHFEKMQIMQVKGSNGIILLYDITNSKSLDWLSKWCRVIRTEIKDDIPILLVGNKLDLEELREVSKEQVEKFKESYDITSLMEISINTGENVEDMLKNITRLVVAKFNPEIMEK